MWYMSQATGKESVVYFGDSAKCINLLCEHSSRASSRAPILLKR